MSTSLLLTEGGVAGHLSHVYENPELTFSEIKEIFQRAANGDLEATVKIDGVNLFLTYSVREGKAKAARNKSDLKTGGMDAKALSKRFEGRGNLELAFVEAFKAFELVARTFDRTTQIEIFGTDGDIYYNCEVLDPRNPNVITYDKKSLVIHRVGHAEFDKSTGTVTGADVSASAKKLEAALKDLQQEERDSEFTVRLNAVKKLQKLSDDTILETAIARLDKALSDVGLGDSAKIWDYTNARIEKILSKELPEVSPEVRALVLRKIQGIKGYTLQTISKYIGDAAVIDKVKSLLAKQNNILVRAIEPIELIVHDFAVEVLKSLHSVFILDSDKEVKRLRKEVAQAIKAIEGSGNEEAISILRQQMKKLKNVDTILTADEGIVFEFNGKVYKFTGTFAPINQLLGLFKYGRGSIPPMTQELNEADNLDDSGKTIAVIPGAFKPPHRGHLAMIAKYAEIADRVIIFMSPLSRTLPDGREITFAMAKKLWDYYLKAVGLDKKVKVLESPVNSPVGASYKFVANEENKPDWAQPGDTVIFGVSTKGGDEERFATNIQKYAREGVKVVGGKEMAVAPTINPATGKELSASDMRAAMSKYDVESFRNFLPEKLQDKAKEILDALMPRTKQLGESLLPFIYQQLQEIVQNSGGEYCLKQCLREEDLNQNKFKVGDVVELVNNPTLVGKITEVSQQVSPDAANEQIYTVKFRDKSMICREDEIQQVQHNSLNEQIEGSPEIFELDYGLRLSRSDLPQIKSTDILTPEVGFKAYLDSKNIAYSETTEAVENLTPIQKEINLTKVDGMLTNVGLENLKRDKPIMISADNYLIDGHHRWYALKMLEPEAEIAVLRIDLDIGPLIEVMKNYPKVFYKNAVSEALVQRIYERIVRKQ